MYVSTCESVYVCKSACMCECVCESVWGSGRTREARVGEGSSPLKSLPVTDRVILSRGTETRREKTPTDELWLRSEERGGRQCDPPGSKGDDTRVGGEMEGPRKEKMSWVTVERGGGTAGRRSV